MRSPEGAVPLGGRGGRESPPSFRRPLSSQGGGSASHGGSGGGGSGTGRARGTHRRLTLNSSFPRVLVTNLKGGSGWPRLSPRLACFRPSAVCASFPSAGGRRGSVGRGGAKQGRGWGEAWSGLAFLVQA